MTVDSNSQPVGRNSSFPLVWSAIGKPNRLLSPQHMNGDNWPFSAGFPAQLTSALSSWVTSLAVVWRQAADDRKWP